MFDEPPQPDEDLGGLPFFVDLDISNTISWRMGDSIAAPLDVISHRLLPLVENLPSPALGDDLSKPVGLVHRRKTPSKACF